MLCSLKMMNVFVLTSYSLDMYHGKAVEQVCVARTHPKHDLLCTPNQQTSQPSARCTARRRVALFLEANNVHLQPIKHPAQWKESFTMPQTCTPNVHGYIVANTRAVVVLNERINPLNLRAERRRACKACADDKPICSHFVPTALISTIIRLPNRFRTGSCDLFPS